MSLYVRLLQVSCMSFLLLNTYRLISRTNVGTEVCQLSQNETTHAVFTLTATGIRRVTFTLGTLVCNVKYTRGGEVRLHVQRRPYDALSSIAAT